MGWRDVRRRNWSGAASGVCGYVYVTEKKANMRKSKTGDAQADLTSQAGPLATDQRPTTTEYEAENGYQQQLTDRTKTPLPTKIRMVTAKARLKAPRRTWLARLRPSQPTRDPAFVIMRRKPAISSN